MSMNLQRMYLPSPSSFEGLNDFFRDECLLYTKAASVVPKASTIRIEITAELAATAKELKLLPTHL